MLIKNKFLCGIILLPAFAFLMQGCAGIETRSLFKPGIDMANYRNFTTVNQAGTDGRNSLRDEVLLYYVSKAMSQMGYSKSSHREARARVTLVFNEGFKQVFVPPSTYPLISYTEGEFTSVTGKIDGKTVQLFGYIPPRRIERYIARPGYRVNVYNLQLRIDIYDADNLKMIWTGTAYMISSPGNAIDDAKKMIAKLLKQNLP